MGVRRATGADLDRLVGYTADLVTAIGGPIAPQSDVVRESMMQIMASPTGTVLVTDGGFIAGVIMPTIISKARVAHELGWYATDKSGLRLLRAFEAWARENGAEMVRVSTKDQDMTRLGYALAETAWTRAL